jgi:hypothetical protein
MTTHSQGEQVVVAALNLRRARHSTERILMAWGGGEAGSVEHSKAAMSSILNDWAACANVGETATSLLALKVRRGEGEEGHRLTR